MVARSQERISKRLVRQIFKTYVLHYLDFKVLKDQCSVNIDKDGGDIAFVTYEKGEAEAKVILLYFRFVCYPQNAGK